MRLSLVAVGFAACATAPAAPGGDQLSQDVRVETVTLDLSADGHGTVGFLLDVASRPGESCTVTRIEWKLMLAQREFAAGVTAASVLVPGGQRARVKVEEPIAFGSMGYDPRARTVPVVLRGEVVTQFSGGEEKQRFGFRTRVAVRGAPIYER